MKVKDVVSGIINKIMPVDRNLTLVCIDRIFSNGTQIVNLYMRIPEDDYLGRPVDVINERYGFFGRKFKQTIETSDSLDLVSMPYSSIKKIIRPHPSIKKLNNYYIDCNN